MLPAPSVLSDSTAAEMVELYWMAKVRDVNFHDYGTNADVFHAITDSRRAISGHSAVRPTPSEMCG